MFLNDLLNSGFSKELIVVLLSVLPVAELRGALPVAINLFHFPWYYAILWALLGNLLPVPFILLFFDAFSRFSGKSRILARLLNWVLLRTRRQSEAIARYRWLGLAIFVGVPLPGTGAWTGSLVAFLLGMKFRQAFSAIFVGVLMAAGIVTSLSLLGWTGAIIAGVGLLAFVLLNLWQAKRKAQMLPASSEERVP
ncbi:MAG: small multi-drug export protein [Chloroflexi bacterium]|nr:small multi-drug export protein [Chloroflexota bacterium]